MTWPVSPSNGQQITINGILFQYDSANTAWNRIFSSGAASAPTYTATVSAAAQPNITSVGTLSGLTVGGTGSVSGANLVSANYITGTLTTAAQPNITSVGTLTSVTATGLITATSGGVKVGNIQDPTGSNTITLASGNVTMLGNLNVGIGGTGNVTATYFIGNGSQLTGQIGNALVSGTVYTNAQPNITSVGTLVSTTIAANSNITMSGSLSQLSGANNLSSNYVSVANNLAVSGLSTFALSADRTTYNGSAVSGTVNLDVSTAGPVWYFTSVSSSFVANIQNVPTTDGYTTVVSMGFVNSAIVPSLQIAGSAQTIKWVNGSPPTGNASATCFYTFTLIRVNSSWVSLGQQAQY